MSQIKYTEIDFETLKTTLINYITQKSEFTNQNKEGSNFNLLVELLAYITNILSFNLNQGINENYLGTAELRSNILKIVKTLGYVPVRRASAKAVVDITINAVEGVETTSKLSTLDKISADKDFYYIGPEIEIDDTGGLPVTLSNIEIYNGQLFESQGPGHAYTGNGLEFQSFIIEDTQISKDYLKIYTVDGTTITEWSLYDNTLIYSESAGSDYLYFLEEVDNGYKVSFGNNKLGRVVDSGEIIGYSYLRSDAKEANDISDFSWSGDGSTTLKYIGGIDFNTISDADITTISSASGGDVKETVAEIKFNAPRYYQTQGRCVTASDYTALVLTDPLVDKASTVGGDELTPIELGVVYVNVKADEDVAGDKDLTSAQLQQLKEFLEERSVVTITVIVQNPQYIYLEPTTKLRYTAEQAPSKTKVIDAIDTFINTSNAEFGDYLEYSQLVTQIDDADNLITSNITTVNSYGILKEDDITNEDTNGDKVEDGDYTITLAKKLNTTSGSTRIERWEVGGSTPLETFVEGTDYTIAHSGSTTDYTNGILNIKKVSGDFGLLDTGAAGTEEIRVYFKTEDNDIFLNKNQIFYLDKNKYTVTTEKVSV